MPEKIKSKPKRWNWAAILVATLSICFGFLLYARFHVNQSVSGDEPHYLLMDYSLIHDHDLNLKNNYQHQDYYSYFPGYLSTELQVGHDQVNPSSPKQYSIHGVGLPLLLLPGVAIGGVRGAAVEMVLIATLTLLLVYAWTLLVTKHRLASLAATVVLASSYFFSGLAGYLYPDILIAGLLVAGLIIIHKYYNRPLWQCLFGLMLGFMVLLHFKTLALAGPLLLALVYRNWTKGRRIPWTAIAILLAFTILFVYTTYRWFGVWNPASIYTNVSLQSSPLHIISALLFDSMRGLLVNNPALLLLFVGLPVWFKVQRETLIMTALVILPSVAILCTFNQWQGGDSPIGRYTVDFLPALMPAIALAVMSARRLWQQLVMGFLVLANLAVTVDFIRIKRGYVRDSIRSPLFEQIQHHFGIAPDRLLPTFSINTTLVYRHGAYKIILGFFVIAVLFAYGVYLSRQVDTKLLPK